MRVRLLCDRADSYGQIYRSGSTIELDREEALILIDRGSAEPVEQPIEQAVEGREIETAATIKQSPKQKARKRGKPRKAKAKT